MGVKHHQGRSRRRRRHRKSQSQRGHSQRSRPKKSRPHTQNIRFLARRTPGSSPTLFQKREWETPYCNFPFLGVFFCTHILPTQSACKNKELCSMLASDLSKKKLESTVKLSWSGQQLFTSQGSRSPNKTTKNTNNPEKARNKNLFHRGSPALFFFSAARHAC